MTSGGVAQAMARALEAQQRRLGTGPRAEANAHALAEGAAVVVTGQQPGLLGGPLLTLHKAAGVLALARAESARTGRPVVPVFWVASEDHDWAEVNRATVIDASGAPRDLALDLRGDQRSVRDVPVPEAVAARLVEDLAAALPPTERGRAARDLAAPPGPGPTDLGTWFGVVLARLLGDAGLVLVEPHVLAPWAGPTFADLAAHAERIASAVAAEGARRRERGLEAPLDPGPGTAPFFLRPEAGGPRRRVRLAGDRVEVRDGEGPADRASLAAWLTERPESASGDVVGRVFLQNALLPVAAILAGPTESAYLAQVAAAHRALDRPFPPVVARPQATWVERRAREALEAAGTSLADACAGLAVPPPPAPADPEVAAAHEALLAAERRLADAARAARARVTGRDDPTPTAIERALDAARREVARAVERHAEEVAAASGRGRARFERALAAVRPKGQAQERVLSPFSLVARHGVEALRAGLGALEPGAPPRVLDLP